MSGPKSEGVNRPSSLLKQYENDEIFSMLGRRCVVSWKESAPRVALEQVRASFFFLIFIMTLLQTLATSVAQLYIAPPENRRAWKKKVTGVICFVKDNVKRSYFLRMYSLVVSSERVTSQLHSRKTSYWPIYVLILILPSSYCRQSR